MHEFWTVLPLTIKQVGERLTGEFGLSDPECDYENVYEWFDATAADGLRLNVSRKHRDGEPDFAEPLRIRASGYRSVDDLGRRLAGCLRTIVYYGEVEYLGGEEFHYHAGIRFVPTTYT
jgi:hypothetical protein